MALMPNDYSIQGIIGEGSFSRVFKLQHKVSGKQFAGKHLNRIFYGKPDIISCTEINVMKRIEDHPNILKLRDLICDSFPCNVILVFELMDMNLYELLRDRQTPLSEFSARIFFFQIVSGIQHLHKNRLFHRDLKPENILLKFPKTKNMASQYKLTLVKLADFGCVKITEMNDPLTDYVATRWYRAPECLLTKGYYGPKMDIWSAGCIFYEMLAQQPLFPGQNELDQLGRIHSILGSPNESVLRRFRHLKINFVFPKEIGVKFSMILPNLSKLGVSVLESCLCYLPEIRIDSTRLQDHYYFLEMRVPNSARRPASGNTSARVQPNSTPKLSPQKLPVKVKPLSPQKGIKLVKKKRQDGAFGETIAARVKRRRELN